MTRMVGTSFFWILCSVTSAAHGQHYTIQPGQSIQLDPGLSVSCTQAPEPPVNRCRCSRGSIGDLEYSVAYTFRPDGSRNFQMIWCNQPGAIDGSGSGYCRVSGIQEDLLADECHRFIQHHPACFQ